MTALGDSRPFGMEHSLLHHPANGHTLAKVRKAFEKWAVNKLLFF